TERPTIDDKSPVDVRDRALWLGFECVIERVRHPLLEVQCSTFCTNRAHTKAPRVADGDSSKKDIFKFHCASCTLATQRVANAMSVEILAKFFISESQAAAMRSKIMTILLSFRASTINNLSDPMPTSASP